MIYKTFEIIRFKKCWTIFEFRLIISSFYLSPSLIEEESSLLYR